MPQEDYLKREIDKFGKVLQKALADLLGLKLKGRLPEGVELSDQILKAELGSGLESISNLPENELLPFFYETKKLSHAHVELIADLLFECAHESSVAPGLYKRALLLYEHISENSPDYSVNRHFKIQSIQKLLA